MAMYVHLGKGTWSVGRGGGRNIGENVLEMQFQTTQVWLPGPG